MRISNAHRSLALLALLLLFFAPAIARNEKPTPPAIAKAAIAKNDKPPAPAIGRIHHDFLAVPLRGATPDPQKEVAPGQVVVPRKKVAGFSRSENAVVRDYFVNNPAKWTALPPGIVKEYGRGKPLPLGVEKKELPWGLMKRLPRRLGYEYCQVGRDVVIIDAETLLVVDIMKDVFG